jgi:hypothetical protein
LATSAATRRLPTAVLLPLRTYAMRWSTATAATALEPASATSLEPTPAAALEATASAPMEAATAATTTVNARTRAAANPKGERARRRRRKRDGERNACQPHQWFHCASPCWSSLDGLAGARMGI